MYGRPVAWINVAAEGRGENADASLRIVLGYVGAVIVEEAVTRVVVGRADVDDGRIAHAGVGSRIEQVVRTFAADLDSRRARQ